MICEGVGGGQTSPAVHGFTSSAGGLELGPGLGVSIEWLPLVSNILCF